MLDMGGVGVPETKNTRINVGKNNKVRAVCLDFHLITRSIEERRRNAELTVEKENRLKNGSGDDVLKKKPLVGGMQPDTSLIEKMANLLNIQLGDSNPIGQKTKRIDDETDDLSAILGSNNNIKQQNEPRKKLSTVTPPHSDIRSKYASKLRNKIDGGVAGLDLAKYEKEDTLKRGDASSHLSARTLISSDAMMDSSATNTSSSRWLANTGVGKLLSFLTSRSMQIILLPLPSTPSQPISDSDVEQTMQEMNSLTKQLPHVHFDLMISDGRRKGDISKANEDAAQDVLNNVLSKNDHLTPLQYVVVSDRDDYLRSAREMGMYTCRVRPKNMRRGEVTASYSVEDVGNVEDVCNEINGISFNSALKR